MSEFELQKAYERFKLSPDADQEEIRRVYLQLRQELDGEDLRLLYSAWENLWSPQNRVRVDAMLLQADRHAPSVDEILTEVGPSADGVEWSSFIDRDGIVQREATAVTSLILERTWLGHAYDTLFPRPAPQPVAQPLPQPTLTPVTKAEPVRAAEAKTAAPVPVSPPTPTPAPGTAIQVAEPTVPKTKAPTALWYRPALAIALMAVLALVFVAARGGFATDDPELTDSIPTSQPTTVARVEPYDAPSMAFIVPTPTPYGQRPLLVVQFVPQTPSALTVPIDSAAIIAEILDRVEKNTEAVEPTESAFGQNIGFGAVSPADRLPVPAGTTLVETLATPEPEASPASTPEATVAVVLPPAPTVTATASPTPAPTATATSVPLLATSRNYANIRSGPGTDFGVVEIVEPDTSRRIIGRTRSAAWLLVETSAGGSGWISLSVVDIDGDVGNINIVE